MLWSTPKSLTLVLTRHSQIFGPAIERSARRRAMQMDGTLAIALVDETYDRLDASRDDDCWPWRYSIVTYQTRRA
jgi:hypothetical protein